MQCKCMVVTGGARARGCWPERGRGAGSGLSGARACVSGATTASAHAWRGARAGCACRYLDRNSLSSVPAGLFDHTTALSQLWVEQQPRGRIAARALSSRVCARAVRLFKRD